MGGANTGVLTGLDCAAIKGISMSHSQDLYSAAKAVRDHAHAPYSKFHVGAAIRDASGRIHVGCNVENVAYPEGTCAEAGAIAAMCASGGSREIAEVVVVADSVPPVTPCGGCRQKLAEFGNGEVTVSLADLDGVKVTMSLAELLPGAFSTQHMALDGGGNG